LSRRLIAIVGAWFVYAEFVALLQWFDVFGSDDQPWQTVFLGNIIYVTIIWGIPLIAGWLFYMRAVNAVATRWPRREWTTAILLAPVALLPSLVLARLTEGWGGVLFMTGYAFVAGLAVLFLRERAQVRP